MKLLLQRAREAIEETKDAEGWYHLGELFRYFYPYSCLKTNDAG
jgi:hypothetical protein